LKSATSSRWLIAPYPSSDARGKQSVDRLYAADHDLLGRGTLEVIDYRVVARSVHGASPIAAELDGNNPVPAVKADGYSVSSHGSDEAVLHFRRIFRPQLGSERIFTASGVDREPNHISHSASVEQLLALLTSMVPASMCC
jgi:hypothetical protein